MCWLQRILVVLLFQQMSCFIDTFFRNTINCGGTSYYKTTNVASPSTNIPQSCIYKIKPHSLFVCQIRVDFTIQLPAPVFPDQINALAYPSCSRGAVTFTDDLVFCGTIIDQHFYLPFNRSDGNDKTFQFQITIPSGISQSQISWKIKVTQLECSLGSPLRTIIPSLLPQGRTIFFDGFQIAPNGCLQYYPEMTGQVRSLNYENGFYPRNFKYSICFRRTDTTTGLRLNFNHFQIGSENLVNEDYFDEFCRTSIRTIGRSEDYLLVPEAEVQIEQTVVRANNFCGAYLQGKSVTSTVQGPLSIIFNGDDLYKGEQESGFEFIYQVI